MTWQRIALFVLIAVAVGLSMDALRFDPGHLGVYGAKLSHLAVSVAVYLVVVRRWGPRIDRLLKRPEE